MRRPGFVPDAGDVVWLEFDPQVGHEQAGRRPAVVRSAANYNGKTGLMVCCPLTTRIKLYPFEVLLAPIGKRRAVRPSQKSGLARTAGCSQRQGHGPGIAAGQGETAGTDRMIAVRCGTR